MIKKICLIGAGLTGGGQERALTNLANQFAEMGHHVTILPLFKTEIFWELNPKIEIIFPDLDRKSHHRLVYALRLLPHIRKQVNKLKPDTILSFGEWFNSYVILATRFLKFPLYITNRMGPLLKLGSLIDNANRLLYRYVDGIIAQTSISKTIIEKNTHNRNVVVIPNAVKPIDVLAKTVNKNIVTVGRLSKEKGHTTLLKAFAKVKETEWKLHIIGDGLERENLVNESTMLGVSERVVFHGYQQNFSAILANCEIFVLPSLYEGFPNALVEAMSVPLACISSNCVAGPSDIIEHGKNGLLVEPGNVTELTNAIDYLIENPEIRDNLATEAFKIRETLNFEVIAKQYLDFILNR